MGERTHYDPGTFCWTDLTTTDPDAAKAFYSELFGWVAQDMPVGDDTYYSVMRIDGKDVAAIAPQPQQQRDAGAPPVWNSYIAVQSADDTVQRATELGGTAHAPAFDVMDAGRMAVVQDPQGAYFLAWQPGRHKGAGLVNAPGAMAWNELSSPDPEAAGAFYSGLFGWTISPSEGGGPPYWMIRNGERYNGGIRPIEQPGVPPHWLVYFGSDDADETVARVGELGGRAIVEPMDISMGRIAIVQDPQGATFALFAGEFED
jgi:hypothetical protein